LDRRLPTRPRVPGALARPAARHPRRAHRLSAPLHAVAVLSVPSSVVSSPDVCLSLPFWLSYGSFGGSDGQSQNWVCALSVRPALLTLSSGTEPFTLQPTLSEVSPLKGSLAPTPALEDNALSLGQAAALVQQRQNLAAEIHDLETQPDGGGETLESRVRELQSQMNVLTREIHTHISPPSYAG
jgi:hypothetical protein